MKKNVKKLKKKMEKNCKKIKKKKIAVKNDNKNFRNFFFFFK